MIKNLLIITSLLFTPLAISVEDAPSIYFGGLSHHFKDDQKYNNNNKLIAVEYKDVVVGTFDNSYNDQSYLIGYNFNTDWLDLQFGVVVGAAYGYDKGDVNEKLFLFGSKLVPIIFPYVTYTKYDLKPTAGIFGKAATLLFEYKF